MDRMRIQAGTSARYAVLPPALPNMPYLADSIAKATSQGHGDGGFPTGLQARMMAQTTVAEGAAMIAETIFENRVMHVSELTRIERLQG